MFVGTRSLAIVVAAGTAACGVGIAADRAEVPDGTTVKARLNQTLNSDRHGTGSGFVASVTESIYGREGETLIPAGSLVHGKVLTFDENPPRLRLEFTDIEVRGKASGLQASLVEFVPTNGGGAAVEGADAATIGAIAAAATGTGAALLTKDDHVFVPAGSILQFELLQALPVSLEAETDPTSISDRESARGPTEEFSTEGDLS